MASSATDSDIKEYLSALKQSAKFGPQVVYHRTIPPRKVCYSDFPSAIPEGLQRVLHRRGVQRLYSHQATAIGHVFAGEDVVVATPTASGKSGIFLLPALSELWHEHPHHTLYLSPLKALAQDQAMGIGRLADEMPADIRRKHSLCGGIYDGDTSSYMRRKLRDTPPLILLTNPEMLHLSLLPYHQQWLAFFSRLRYVVIDEVHSYRGILGSHMAWIIRRLQRITNHYGGRPVFILLSATIGNPGELGEQLLGSRPRVVDDSGAPQAKKNFLFINPWDSASFTASQLLEAALKRGLRTIVYTQSRRMTELINLWTAPRLGGLAAKLSAYRAGFLPEERREIEAGLHSGKLLGVISTSALELGIDIGDLDLCLLVGYPGSIMSTLQRGGRVGRMNRESATVLIGGEDALDQFFMRNPDDFFSRSPEAAVLNPYNPSLLEKHLHCAAAEMVLTAQESLLTEKRIMARIATMTEAGSLYQTAAGNRWISSRKRPQRLVSLRGGGRQLSIIDQESGEIVGQIDIIRALKECHPGAVYLHRAISYVVTHLDIQAGEVLARKETPAYFTRPLSEKHTRILSVTKQGICGNARVSFGTLRVTEKVTGYQKRHSRTHKLINTHPLDLPEQIMETEGIWLEIIPEIEQLLQQRKLHFMGAIHALEHAMIAMFPLLVLCDRNDIGGISCPVHDQTEHAAIFIYDGYPGGVGLSQLAFDKVNSLLQVTAKTVSTCHCENGCPSCVHSPKCGSGNRPIDKKACISLLHEITRDTAEQPLTKSGAPVVTYNGNNRPADTRPRGLAALPQNYGVFDVETKHAAEEVGGWHNAHRMGVSVAVVYDGPSGEFFSFVEDEIPALIDLLTGYDLVVGFNNKRFDNRVLTPYTRCDLHRLPTLDLLQEIHDFLGYRLSLNRLAETTLGVKKSSDGLQALKWYKEGRLDLIQKYCRKDVEITRDLLHFGLEHGYLLFRNKAGHEVRLPLSLDLTINRIVAESAEKPG